jgi:hypothetical protein
MSTMRPRRLHSQRRVSTNQQAPPLRGLGATPLQHSVREFEITMHVSLAGHELPALKRLRKNGECDVKLPEPVFDRDCPGHYLRRIKSVALSIQCITGPYTGEKVKLTLVSNKVRMTISPLPHYPEHRPNDPRFAYSVGTIRAVARRSSQDDSELFHPSDSDERYQPFEGVGAISHWHLDMRTPNSQFDFSTISDVVLHIRYTARDASSTLREGAVLAASA